MRLLAALGNMALHFVGEQLRLLIRVNCPLSSRDWVTSHITRYWRPKLTEKDQKHAATTGEMSFAPLASTELAALEIKEFG